MHSRVIFTLLICFTAFSSIAQAPKQPSSAEIFHAIQKLNVLGTALYVGAHPDDENTHFISYLANEKKVRTAYLSLTRGDGGQNLIGPEMQELLGVIRTQELLMARNLDGGTQFFSRAIDFGYSKNPEESLEFWNKNEILSDVVWTIRTFRPDVVINRFSHDSKRKTHGHHSASAKLSYEAFDLAGKKEAFPEQLAITDIWSPRRMFFNTSWRSYGSRQNFDKADKSKMGSVDVGAYYPVLGVSNNEIAARSRSMHKCQGFGASGNRGRQMEYVKLLKGTKPGDQSDIFSGINTTWTRVKGGAPIGAILKQVEEEFRLNKPEASLPKLIEAMNLMKRLEDPYWKEVKLEEIKNIITWCMGLFVEVAATDPFSSPGDSLDIEIEFVNRTYAEVMLNSISIPEAGYSLTLNENLDINLQKKIFERVKLSEKLEYTTPYWLIEPKKRGSYTVQDQRLRGTPEAPKALRMDFLLTVNDVQIPYTREIVYKETDPVKGEVYSTFEILPPVSVKIEDQVFVFASQRQKKVGVIVKANSPGLQSNVKLNLPEGWKCEPPSYKVEMEVKGSEKRFEFLLTPPEYPDEGFIEAVVPIRLDEYRQEVVNINYDHIPHQTVLLPSRSKVVRIDLRKEGSKIGYIQGAGDKIPASLEQIGYEVSEIDPATISSETLEKYHAVIIGIRAYNTVERLKFVHEILMGYIRNGGTLITQFNTSHRLVTDQLGPYDITLSRDRVTVEDAPVKFIDPNHDLLNYPNRITKTDFDGWVQERGLYFPNDWDEAYVPILECNDPGEKPCQGSLLVAKYGEGYHIYTGISWFRQLPAGVPGAYRIFTNLVSIGKSNRP